MGVPLFFKESSSSGQRPKDSLILEENLLDVPSMPRHLGFADRPQFISWKLVWFFKVFLSPNTIRFPLLSFFDFSISAEFHSG